ncbi:MAG: low-complexity tail membrane protein [Cyanobacteriota bacterium]|nr:low-complexity tail membrane protein [Cyanobacteriota bacterium]
MNPRSEPLLWLQLIGLGALPLQALLLLLLLAGSDPGRLPTLERLFTWAIGALLPGLLLLRRPADPFSLLLVSTPLRARRELQRRLATLQAALPPKAGLAVGMAGALALLVWADEHAALAAALSPLDGSPRLVALLLAALLLAVMVWQWQQVIQALWLLSRPEAAVAAATPMPTADIGDQRLCLGLPLLLPDPLQLPEPRAVAPPPPSPPTPAAPVTPIVLPSEVDAAPEALIEPEATEPSPEPVEAEPVAETEASEEVEWDVNLEAYEEVAGVDAVESIASPEAEAVAEVEAEVVAEPKAEVAEPEAEVGEAAIVEVVAEAEPDPEPRA